MIEMKRIAIIPARGGSKRVPRKNLAEINGRPMIAHPIATARASGVFERVIVSTEDREIANVSEAAGAEVFWRSEALADDQATVVAVCKELVDAIARVEAEPDIFCCIYPTALFVNVEDLIQSLALLEGASTTQVAMAVSAYAIHPYKALESVGGYLRPLWPESNQSKSQTFPRLVASNGTFYWARTASFRANPTFYPERLVGYELPPSRAIDVDTTEDLAWVQRLARLYSLERELDSTNG